MSDLRFNTIAGTALASVLGVMGLRIGGEALFHPHVEPEPAIEVAIQEATAPGGGEAEAEGPTDFGALLADDTQLASFVARGEKQKAVCAACHSFDQGGANGTGPALWGVMGRTAGTHAGFAYSESMKAYAQPWTYETLDAFLESPQRHVKGTSMTFAGIRKDEDRVGMIAYLRSLAASPAPLPAPLPAPEPAAPAPEEVTASAAPADAAAPEPTGGPT